MILTAILGISVAGNLLAVTKGVARHIQTKAIARRMAQAAPNKVYPLKREVPELVEKVTPLLAKLKFNKGASFEFKVVNIYNTFLKKEPLTDQKALFHAVLFAIESVEADAAAAASK